MIVGWSGIGRAVLLTAALALGGCDTVGGWLGFGEDNTLELGPSCPRVAIGDDVGYVARFDGNGSKRANLRYAVKMAVPNGGCFLNENSIEVEMTVPIYVERGPAMEDREINFEYFVAIARTDKTIIFREAYKIGTEMRLGEVAFITEEFDESIPIEVGEPGSNFVIIVGLILTEGRTRLCAQSEDPWPPGAARRDQGSGVARFAAECFPAEPVAIASGGRRYARSPSILSTVSVRAANAAAPNQVRALLTYHRITL